MQKRGEMKMRERFKNSLILDILPIIFIIVFGEISMCNQEISPLLSHFSTRIGYLSLS